MKSRSLKILLAEDNAVNQALAVQLLKQRGHMVVVAGDGQQAVNALGLDRFDLVLMDLQMPNMDGFAAVAEIRRRERESAESATHLPVIALTACAMKGDRERCLAAGFDDHVSKPIRTKELDETLARYAPAEPEPAVDPIAVVEHTSAPEPDREPERAEIDFDRSAALDRMEGDQELLRTIADLFLQSAPGLRDEIAGAVHRGDAGTLHRAAHTLSGAASALAAARAVTAARHLETLGRENRLSDAEAAVSDLDQALDRLRPALIEVART